MVPPARTAEHGAPRPPSRPTTDTRR